MRWKLTLLWRWFYFDFVLISAQLRLSVISTSIVVIWVFPNSKSHLTVPQTYLTTDTLSDISQRALAHSNKLQACDCELLVETVGRANKKWFLSSLKAFNKKFISSDLWHSLKMLQSKKWGCLIPNKFNKNLPDSHSLCAIIAIMQCACEKH